jgi:hypothetical protein
MRTPGASSRCPDFRSSPKFGSENSVRATFGQCLLPRDPVPGRWLNILRVARGPRTSSLIEVEYPRAALGKGEPDDDPGVVIRHPDGDAYDLLPEN